jgi:hypothetical protein
LIIFKVLSLFFWVRPAVSIKKDGGLAADFERLDEENHLLFPGTVPRIVVPVGQSLYLLSYGVPIILMFVALTERCIEVPFSLYRQINDLAGHLVLPSEHYLWRVELEADCQIVEVNSGARDTHTHYGIALMAELPCVYHILNVVFTGSFTGYKFLTIFPKRLITSSQIATIYCKDAVR